ncbi:MAG: hypothetical protein QG632_215 [Candidatus Dependentiae bacterium]|nr:hypothetical protein [Candidatus Dependentiae bacterium]
MQRGRPVVTQPISPPTAASRQSRLAKISAPNYGIYRLPDSGSGPEVLYILSEDQWLPCKTIKKVFRGTTASPYFLVKDTGKVYGCTEKKPNASLQSTKTVILNSTTEDQNIVSGKDCLWNRDNFTPPALAMAQRLPATPVAADNPITDAPVVPSSPVIEPVGSTDINQFSVDGAAPIEASSTDVSLAAEQALGSSPSSQSAPTTSDLSPATATGSALPDGMYKLSDGTLLGVLYPNSRTDGTKNTPCKEVLGIYKKNTDDTTLPEGVVNSTSPYLIQIKSNPNNLFACDQLASNNSFYISSTASTIRMTTTVATSKATKSMKTNLLAP